MHSAPKFESETPTSRRQIWRRILVWVAIVLAVLLIVQYGASRWLSHQRAQVEQQLTQATGYTVQIKGSLSVTLWPTPGLVLHDVELARGGKPVATVKMFRSNFELLPLFAGKYISHAIHISGMDLHLRANAQGAPLFPSFGPSTAAGPAVAAASGRATTATHDAIPAVIDVRDTSVSVLSPKGKKLYSVDGLNVAAHRLSTKPALKQEPDGNWAFAIYANFRQASIGPVILGPARLTAHAQPKRVDIEINKASLFAGNASGTVSWVDEGANPRINTKLTVTDFSAAQAVTAFQKRAFVDGRANLAMDISTSGATKTDLLRRAAGTIKVSGSNLQLVTVNLDDLVARIIQSQHYNLVDVAAYFFFGPLGASVSKGLDIVDVFKELGKSGTTKNQILRMVSSWKLADGSATATDVALETNRYRLALQGKLNLMKSEFENVRIAVIDERGCAIASQRLDGPITSPRIEKVNMLISVTQPMLDALSKSAKGLVGGKCSPFYRGSLLPRPPSIGTSEQGNTTTPGKAPAPPKSKDSASP